MGKFGRVLLDNIHAQIRLVTIGNTELDFSGLQTLKCRLQLGAADELTLVMPAQLLEGEWRSDMGQWQVGGTVILEMGYDGTFTEVQQFEIVSSTTMYTESGDETITIRGVSDLARAARNTEKRVFDSGSDADILTEICTEYGWINGVEAELSDPKERLKEKGTSDLNFLKLIARQAGIGGPRLDFLVGVHTLIMPEPVVGPLQFVRGISTAGNEEDIRRLMSLTSNRDGGGTKTQVGITSWDKTTKTFVKVVFEADPFGGDPIVKYEGAPSTKEIPKDSTTEGLVLSVIEARGHGKNERSDILSIGRFLNEEDAIALAKRWFDLRELLSRWANVKLEGSVELMPYLSINLDGNLAEMDKGEWLPIWIEHNISSSGWISTARSVRIVNENVVITPV